VTRYISVAGYLWLAEQVTAGLLAALLLLRPRQDSNLRRTV